MRHHEWIAAHRDLDRDGLIWIVQPDESGLDAAPQFDAIWKGHADGLPGFLLLVHRNRELGWDLRRIAAAGGPVCCEVMTNVLYGLSLLALGRPSLTQTLVERLYDERAGLFRPIARPEPEREATVTWAALSPLALPDLPEAVGRRLVEEHLLDAERFWLPVPPPSVPATDPSFSPRERGSASNATGAGRLGSMPPGLSGSASSGSATPIRRARSASVWAPRWARGVARVLRPLHGTRDGRHELRVVVADHRADRPRPARCAELPGRRHWDRPLVWPGGATWTAALGPSPGRGQIKRTARGAWSTTWRAVGPRL